MCGRGGGAWFPNCSRRFNEREVDEVVSLLSDIQDKRILPSQEDLMLLKESSVGNFSVKCLYKVLDSSRVVALPHQFIWNNWVPSKVGVFAWEVAWGKILTLDMLKRCGRVLANICFL